MEGKVGRGHKRATDDQVVSAYRETGSVWKAAKLLGLAGQTVQERLARLDVPIAHARWTDDEDQELQLLFADPHMTVADVAKRLNRTSASVSCRAGELGIKKIVAPKHKRVPRGKGYDKQSLMKHVRAIESFDGSLTKYCRSNGLNVENFAIAVQKSFPDWWNNYVISHSDLEQINCNYCNDPFYPNNKRQRFCSRKCSSDSRRDRDYFGGNRRSGEGVLERICQICLKNIGNGKVHVHHVYGKSRDPSNEHLAALCSRCHMALEQICTNPSSDSSLMWVNMMKFVWLKRDGWKSENTDKTLKVFLARDVG